MHFELYKYAKHSAQCKEKLLPAQSDESEAAFFCIGQNGLIRTLQVIIELFGHRRSTATQPDLPLQLCWLATEGTKESGGYEYEHLQCD